MTLPLVVGTLLVGAIVVAAVRQQFGSRKGGRPLELGVKHPTIHKQ